MMLSHCSISPLTQMLILCWLISEPFYSLYRAGRLNVPAFNRFVQDHTCGRNTPTKTCVQTKTRTSSSSWCMCFSENRWDARNAVGSICFCCCSRSWRKDEKQIQLCTCKVLAQYRADTNKIQILTNTELELFIAPKLIDLRAIISKSIIYPRLFIFSPATQTQINQ